MAKFSYDPKVNRKRFHDYYVKAYNPKYKGTVEDSLYLSLHFERLATFRDSNSASILYDRREQFHEGIEMIFGDSPSTTYLQTLELYQQIRADADDQDRSREASKDMLF